VLLVGLSRFLSVGYAGVLVVLFAVVVFGLAVMVRTRLAREQSSGNGSVIDEYQRSALYQRLYEVGVAQEQSRTREAQLLRNDDTVGMDVKPEGRVTLEEHFQDATLEAWPLIVVSKYARTNDQDHGRVLHQKCNA